jgi:hypothetical protein
LNKPRIFLCHASEDKPRVAELYHKLKAAGYNPWLDKEDLLPGQDWRHEIEKIIHDPYNIVLVCLSCNSITKRGTVQREIKRALDVLEEMPEDTIYLIPARLEDCRVPDQLSDYHRVDLFEPDGFDKLTRALDFEINNHQSVHQSIESGVAPLPAGKHLTAGTIQKPETDQLKQDRKEPRSRKLLATLARNRRKWIVVILLMLVVVGSSLAHFKSVQSLQMQVDQRSAEIASVEATNIALEEELASVQTSQTALYVLLTALEAAQIDQPDVYYEDTDGDSNKEWVVFYQFDTTSARSPYAGVVYDYDLGKPPVIFPYRLLPPGRFPLSEGTVRLEFKDITEVDESRPTKELLVYGRVGGLDTDLNIFRPRTIPSGSEFPLDEPRRYQVIGSFRGDGGVTFDPATKIVTALNRAGYDRSQLSVEARYALDAARGTYMSVSDPEQLSAPIASQVIFPFGMPPDILDTPYPEKLVVGFYEMLEKEEPPVSPLDFLTGEALFEYDRGNLAYFGFENVTGQWADVNELKIMQLSYAPEFEEFDPSVTVLGSDPRFLVVGVVFEAKVGQASTRTSAPLQWVTIVEKGKWKIDHRL